MLPRADLPGGVQFGEAKESGLRTFLKLPNGIPSHDTFGRIFAALDPEVFGRCFSSWIAAVSKVTKGSVVAIDGKTLRRSFDAGSEKAAIHMVSAWADFNELVLGQRNAVNFCFKRPILR